MGTEGCMYLRMMSDILRKKEQHLQELLNLTKQQEHLLKDKEFSEAAFSELMDKKEIHIKKVLEFDSGFQAIYNRIEEELKQHRQDYREQVEELQTMITRVTELGVAIQALEQKNKTGMEAYLSERKHGIKQFKVSRQTADRYYKNMVGMKQGASYFMDEKQ